MSNRVLAVLVGVGLSTQLLAQQPYGIGGGLAQGLQQGMAAAAAQQEREHAQRMSRMHLRAQTGTPQFNRQEMLERDVNRLYGFVKENFILNDWQAAAERQKGQR